MADVVRRGRRMASEAGRRAVAPVVALRQQREDLEVAVASLQDARHELAVVRQELAQCEDQLAVARQETDTRRAGDEVELVIRRVVSEHLTELTGPELRDLALAVQDLETNHAPGWVVEAGSSLGGSTLDGVALVLAAAKGTDRPMTVYRVSDEQRDDLVGSFDRLGVVPDESRVQIAVGPFEETMSADEPVAFAHLAAVEYDSTRTCLERVAPVLVSGGRIVLDEDEKRSEGREAVNEYFKDRRVDFRFEQHHRRHVVRR